MLALHNNLDYLINFVNKEFKKVTDYFRSNLLSLHPSKTKFVLFSLSSNTPKKIKIVINNNNGDNLNPSLVSEIEQVTGNDSDPAIRFLGLQIDPSLNFKYHTSCIMKKVSSAMFFLRNAKNILSCKALRSVYFSLIHSHIIYAIQVWSSCPQSHMNSLFRLQKKAIRLISGSPYNAHTETLFKKFNILPLPLLVDFFKIQFMQQFSSGHLPKIFTNIWTTNAARQQYLNLHNYPLRNSDYLYIPPARLKLTERHPLHLFPRMWADFNLHEVKHIRDKQEFNFKYKQILLNSLQDNYRCTRLLCPRCHLPSASSDSDN